MNIALILLAGGLSTRMGPEFSKVFYMHNGKSIVEYSLDFFKKNHLITHVVVVCPENKRLLFPSECIFALPGKERFLSVKNGLTALPKGVEFALVHDGARPLLVKKDIEKLIETGMDCDGAALAGRINSTMTQVRSDQTVEKMIDRDGLWETYTPQFARVQDLLRAIEVCENLDEIPNDEMTLLHRINLSPKLIETTFPNIKITYPCDLPLACALLDQLHGSKI